MCIRLSFINHIQVNSSQRVIVSLSETVSEWERLCDVGESITMQHIAQHSTAPCVVFMLRIVYDIFGNEYIIKFDLNSE